MKRKRLLLDELVSETKDHTLRVKCSTKFRVREEPGKMKTRCMKFTDEKGTEISAFLFGVNVDIFDLIIENGNEYEISNVLVRDVKPQFLRQGMHKQELIITDSTVVHKILGEHSSEPTVQWYSIERLPKNTASTARFDVVGVVLHVEPPKSVTTFRMCNVEVCEIFVTDDSCDKVLLIFAWSDLAATLYEKLKGADSETHVISLTFLKASTYKGYSLGTTSASHYQLDAMDERAEFLKEWCKVNAGIVESRKIYTRTNQILPSPIEMVSISEALLKKAEDINPGIKLKITVRIEMFKTTEVRFSVGCQLCNRNCENGIGEAFNCISCSKMSIAQPKLYLLLKASDNSGTIQLAAFTKHVEQLLGISASDLHLKSSEEKIQFINTAASNICSGWTDLLIVPALSLLVDHKKVKWTLKDVLK